MWRWGSMRSLSKKLNEARSEDARRKIQEKLDKILRRESSLMLHVSAKLKQLNLDLDNKKDIDWSDPVVMRRAMKVISLATAQKFDMMYEFWLNSILSAPATQMRNITGNTVFSTWEFTIQRFAEIAMNKMLPGSKTAKAKSATFGELKNTYQEPNQYLLNS